MRQRFFYTTYTPYRFSNGPVMHYLNSEMTYIRSLDEARELAHAKAVESITSSRVETSYGIEYIDD